MHSAHCCCLFTLAKDTRLSGPEANHCWAYTTDKTLMPPLLLLLLLQAVRAAATTAVTS
jgi:hypothetical protein